MHAKFFADVSANANLADDILVRRVQLVGGAADVQALVPPVVFSLVIAEERVSDNTEFLCHQMATMIVKMHVRRGSALLLRNLARAITKQPKAEPLPSRSTLELLGDDTIDGIAAAADRLHSDVEIGNALLDTGEGGTILLVLYDRVYHSDKRINRPLTDVGEHWLDFGFDDPSKKKGAVEN